jgi:hypothetical protein
MDSPFEIPGLVRPSESITDSDLLSSENRFTQTADEDDTLALCRWDDDGGAQPPTKYQ